MKQIIRSIPGSIRAKVQIPGSKSMTNRAFLLAALAAGESHLFNVLISDDTIAMIEALNQLGISIQLDKQNNSCLIVGAGGPFPKKEATIYCAEAGTVARFLLPSCAASEGVYHFDAAQQLLQRPIAGLLAVLINQGVKVTNQDNKMPLTLESPNGLRGGDVYFNAFESSQFVSGLMIAAPLIKSPLTLEVEDAVSKPYIEMTYKMMSDFGVLVRRIHQSKFHVPIPQHYIATNYMIEPDLSTAANFFAAAAVTGGEISIQPIQRSNTKQGDVAFISILEKMGCETIENETSFTFKGGKSLSGISIDMRDFSDTFMALAAIAPFANSPTTMTNIKHVRLKESDRLKVMRQELTKIGVKVEEGDDWLRIFPSKPTAGIINSHYDHRIAMAFSIIGLRVNGIEIDHAECVSKTCPNFFELWKSLSAKVGVSSYNVDV